MDIPLGKYIGNSLEVMEAVETLRGEGPEDLTEVCLALAADMLHLAGKGETENCKRMAEAVIQDGSAWRKLIEMTEEQGGDSSVIMDPRKFEKAVCSYSVLAEETGYIGAMDTEGCGIASSLLGAGRETKDSSIDYTAGIEVRKKTGDHVEKGEIIAVFYAKEEKLFPSAEKKYRQAVSIQEDRPEEQPLIYARVTMNGVEDY